VLSEEEWKTRVGQAWQTTKLCGYQNREKPHTGPKTRDPCNTGVEPEKKKKGESAMEKKMCHNRGKKRGTEKGKIVEGQSKTSFKIKGGAMQRGGEQWEPLQ